ncbi:hypothetical protein N657DRAFT_581472 [Parathielavia appendiculata]|uniref:Uncharacterized protein n=1 Tax=Parathielavia appendiculata TaxID=2587402 RepID=A0AAN6TRX1_9PEZI|nr:hypothetical protein N657DRAFT_581472 [Parathielavia appendiculata]
MPPKRAAATGASRAKKSRPSTEAGGTDGSDTAVVEAGGPPTSIPRNKRWAAVSGSANADAEYKMKTSNPLIAYKFVCMCQPPFPNGEDDEDEEDEENEDAETSDKSAKRPKCDGGETCLCDKPAAEHPDHVWKFSAAGKIKFFTLQTQCMLRYPDMFNMYTFNDHEGYGVLEVIQNLILDFEEAADNYKEQWAVCEALAMFLATDLAAPVTRIDDSDTVDDTYQLIGRLFMSMLAQLEGKKLLTKDSEIINLGLVMALFMDFARGARDYGLLEDSNEESLGPAKDKKKWEPHAFDNQILTYARKYDISLVGPHDIKKTIDAADGDVDLPAEKSVTGKADPFGFTKSLKKYKSDRGGITAFLAGNKSSKTPIGGDHLDITTWSSAKRKSKAFDKKDPLGKKEIDALKEGLVLSVA